MRTLSNIRNFFWHMLKGRKLQDGIADWQKQWLGVRPVMQRRGDGTPGWWPVREGAADITRLLTHQQDEMRRWAKENEQRANQAGTIGDLRLVKAILLVEECGELLHALALEDRQEMADALGDVRFVIGGIAYEYQIPIDRVSYRVLESNRTKQYAPRGEKRLKSKGANYQPPVFDDLLE